MSKIYIGGKTDTSPNGSVEAGQPYKTMGARISIWSSFQKSCQTDQGPWSKPGILREKIIIGKTLQDTGTGNSFLSRNVVAQKIMLKYAFTKGFFLTHLLRTSSHKQPLNTRTSRAQIPAPMELAEHSTQACNSRAYEEGVMRITGEWLDTSPTGKNSIPRFRKRPCLKRIGDLRLSDTLQGDSMPRNSRPTQSRLEWIFFCLILCFVLLFLLF